MLLSGICVVQCLAIPAVALLLPALGAVGLDALNQGSSAHRPLVHWVLLALAVPLSSIALWLGFRQHRLRRVLILGALGLGSMFLGVSHLLGLAAEVSLSAGGALILLAAHIINIRHSH